MPLPLVFEKVVLQVSLGRQGIWGRLPGPKLESYIDAAIVGMGPVSTLVFQGSVLGGLGVLRYDWRVEERTGSLGSENLGLAVGLFLQRE